MTYSIVARCERTGDLGVAVTSSANRSGEIVPRIKSNVGAIARQGMIRMEVNMIDGRYRPFILLEEGKSVNDVMQHLLHDDKFKEEKQYGVVDNNGNSLSHTGNDCPDVCGSITDKNVSVQGNTLTGDDVLKNVFNTFKDTEQLDLEERLMLSLESGNSCGGDKRVHLEKKSAGLKVYSKDGIEKVNIEINDCSDPIPELRKKLDLQKNEFH